MRANKLTAEDPEEERVLYKVVRLDTYEDVCADCLILAAYEATGVCTFRIGDGSSKEETIAAGIRIVLRRR